MEQWVRMRLRSILRKRHGGEGRGAGRDHIRWPNRSFEKLGLYWLNYSFVDILDSNTTDCKVIPVYTVWYRPGTEW